MKNPIKAMKDWVATPLGQVGNGIYDCSPPMAYFAKGLTYATAPIAGVVALFQKKETNVK